MTADTTSRRDITNFIEWWACKTPEERVRDLQSAINGLEKMRGKPRRKAADGPGTGTAQETA